MFSGIVEETGVIREAREMGGLRRLFIEAQRALEGTRLGDSVAVSGVCLTVVELGSEGFAVELAQETLRRTARRWEVGQRVNLERALALGDRLGGHLVTGHVDGRARVVRINREMGAWDVWLEVPQELTRYIAPKGSVALDGVSLTVAGVEGNRFWVTLIPHTLEVTTLKELAEGDEVNLEVDLLARYLERLVSTTGVSTTGGRDAQLDS
ncbi:riboflavin synthase [Meiothermus ruber]|jgi:riboflavin synthase|uniref:Riboflavin synthase n=1 Tax=Meiothermus ruber (strain ATCC 35948 / DSM 1279 / VKM B-1258 / 21) TaxID=504728 RepID=D3PRD3_MEIRD|nr:riboflavin synthase [Meiothermus ruber]ADD28016.1 riboflavin synthase, alpha subunit [Meiothermus ruber DSM 1279]AGK04486.1 riboflavin synthase subunit alpha [Meiothermus ruber DSM 1279]MCL6531332.1 riboflavin synthase [Meiothermus ruber]GAO74961.1 riboflavin synthase subunit alpha [Meiothermus ruber H328]